MKTAPSTPGVTVTFTVDAAHRCPFKDELDSGTITVEWRTTDLTVELHSLRHHLDNYRDVEISHEDLTAQVRDQLALTGVDPLNVEWHGTTAGGYVSAVLRKPDRPRT